MTVCMAKDLFGVFRNLSHFDDQVGVPSQRSLWLLMLFLGDTVPADVDLWPDIQVRSGDFRSRKQLFLPRSLAEFVSAGWCWTLSLAVFSVEESFV